MHARNSSFRNFEIGLYVVGISSVGLGVGLWYTDFKGLCLPLIMLGLYVLFLRKPIRIGRSNATLNSGRTKESFHLNLEKMR